MSKKRGPESDQSDQPNQEESKKSKDIFHKNSSARTNHERPHRTLQQLSKIIEQRLLEVTQSQQSLQNQVNQQF